HAIMTDHEPKFQGAKAAAERNLPVAIINHRTRLCGLITQILGQNAQGLNQRFAIGNIKAVAVKVSEHPLVRIESVTVGELNSVMSMPELGAERGCSRHRGINVEPYIAFPANAANFGQRINRIRGSGPNRSANEARHKARATIEFHPLCERIRTHGEVLVNLDQSQIVQAKPGNLYVLLDGRV